MVLELYCRKSERKREDKRKRGAGQSHVERGGKGDRRRARDESKKGASLRERGGAKQSLL
jgi:hypothetical protein